MTEVKKEKPSVWDKLDVPIEHSGRAITLPGEPEKMPLKKAIEALVRKAADEEQLFNVVESIDAFPTDAAVAFVKAMIQLYGWASPQTQMTFFGPRPPTMMSIKTGPGVEDVIQCPLGEFKLPGVDEAITTIIHPSMGFVVHGNIKKRDKHLVLEIVTLARQIVREQSIYRGKPIQLNVDEDGDLKMNEPPIFLDVTDISEGDVLFDDAIKAQIDVNILVPIKETERCRREKIPLKRTALFEGQYGTGKSLSAKMIARVAELNGWTFILLDKAAGLKAALEFANRYAPAVVFAEDIDRIMTERTDSANDLMITIDGVVSKRAEIMTILTTNHVEKIHVAMLRPGRLDCVISLRAPSAKTVEKLLRYYARDLLPADENLKAAGKELAGQIPASIRECVERAKLGMVGRRANTLSDHDIVVAAQSMKAHLALLVPPEEKASVGDQLATTLRKVVTDGKDSPLTKTYEKVMEIHNHLEID